MVVAHHGFLSLSPLKKERIQVMDNRAAKSLFDSCLCNTRAHVCVCVCILNQKVGEY